MSNRDAYVEKYKAKLDEWNAEIAKLEAKAEQAGADAKVQYQQEVDKLNARLKEARKNMEEIQAANEAAFKDLKSGAEKMWKSFEDSIQKAWSRYK